MRALIRNDGSLLHEVQDKARDGEAQGGDRQKWPP